MCNQFEIVIFSQKCLVEERTVFGQRYFTSRCEHGQVIVFMYRNWFTVVHAKAIFGNCMWIHCTDITIQV